MEKFNYGIGTDNSVKVYDNQGAYNTLQEMMKRKEQLIVKFYGSKDNTRCAWIESAHVAGGKSSVSCPLKPSDSAPLKHSTMPP